MPEDEYLRRMSSLPKVKAPDDFLRKVRDRIDRRPFREKLIHALFVPFRIKIPLEVAAVTAALMLLVSTMEVNRPARQLAYAPKPDVIAAKEAVMDNASGSRLADEFRQDAKQSVSSLEDRIIAAGGSITRMNADKDKAGESYIDVEVPADRYRDFISRLSDLQASGKIRISPVLKDAPHGRNIIQLRIFVI